MDRETLSNYGWIIVIFIILSLMLTFASPLTDYVLGNVGKLPDQIVGTDSCKHEHTEIRESWVKYNNIQHQKFNETYCTDCGKKLSQASAGVFENHTYDSEYLCTKCGYKHTHVFDTLVSITYEEIPGDAYSHYAVITKSCACGETMTSREKQTHRYGDDEPNCIDCGAARSSITYQITYNANGGTGAPATQTKRKGVAIVLSSTEPSNGTKIFLGWGLASDAKTAIYQPGDTYNTDEALSLFAVWKDPLILIASLPVQSNSLVYNGSSQSPTWSGYDSDKMIIEGVQEGTNAGRYVVYFTPKPGYCWSDETTTAKPVAWIIDRATISTGVPTQNGTLRYNGFVQYPTWNNYDENKLAISGTTSSQGNPNSNTNYTATFTPTINYKWSDGTITGKDATWTILACDHSSTHYEYAAESPTHHFKTEICNMCGSEVSASSLEVHEWINDICWKCGEPRGSAEDSFLVTFNPNGGTGGPNKMYGVGDTTIPSDVPVKADNICIGWSTDPSATSAMVAPGGTYNITSDVTLYAVWRSEYVTITFDANGGSGGPSTQHVKYGESSTLKSSTPSKSGYVFDDWRSPATGSPFQIYHPGGTYTFTSDMTLTAMWNEASSGGGSGSGSGGSGGGDFATCNHEYYYNNEGERVDIVQTSGYFTDGIGGHYHIRYSRCTYCGACYFGGSWHGNNNGTAYSLSATGVKQSPYKSVHIVYPYFGDPTLSVVANSTGTYCDGCDEEIGEYILVCYVCEQELAVMSTCGSKECPYYKDPDSLSSYGWNP